MHDPNWTRHHEALVWAKFTSVFLKVFVGATAVFYLLVLLVDPYDVVRFSLPLDRRIVSISQRHMYPQIVRSRRFDSLIVGTSTSRLIDPKVLDSIFGGRFANLSMDSMTAWEQQAIIDLFLRSVGPPKTIIIGLDGVWCDPAADINRITPRGFPHWLYDDNPWNDLLYLLNTATLEIAVRLIAYQLGFYRERIRYDGYEVFVPPESQYDLVRAQRGIWGARKPELPSDLPPPMLSATERAALAFPALQWLDTQLGNIPNGSKKILVYMPVHVAAQPWPGTWEAAVEMECKQRIAAIARARAAIVIDWRISSPLTRNDANYWDALHYRLPVATRIATEIGAAVEGRSSSDGSYVITVP